MATVPCSGYDIFTMLKLRQVIFVMLVLWLRYSYGSRLCSDKVSLRTNINGEISIKPRSIVHPGTAFTVVCSGTDAEQSPGDTTHSALDYKISVITIFEGDFANKTCLFRNDDKKECAVNLTSATTNSMINYSCSFRTNILPKYSCFISKVLTVTNDVCLSTKSLCSANSTCHVKANSYTCICDPGFYKNGSDCEDIQECSNSSLSPCHKDAKCIELEGSFNCICKTGFTGNGTYCKDMKECSSRFPCHTKANCVDNTGSFNCSCKQGFTGNGTHCQEIKSVVNEDESSTSSKRWTIIGTVCAIVVICVTGLAFLLYKQRKKSHQGTSKSALEIRRRRATAIDNLGILFPSTEKKELVNSPRRKLPSIEDHNKIGGSLDEEFPDEDCVFSYICVLDDWEIVKGNLTILEKKLGGGQFGIVKKGMYKDKAREKEEIPVAIKMLKDASSANDRSDLLTELQILKQVNKQSHPNVIKLIGAITSEEPIMVITEYCSRGSLQNVLQKSRVKENVKNSPEHYINIVSTLSHRILLKLAVDIASGMKHLSAHQFVHRDLSTRNILVSSKYEAKVSDFGLARPISDDNQMYVKSNRNLLPVKWMALESLTHGVFRTSSDIWAFGVVLWEITTLGKEPYPGISPYDVLNYLACGSRMERPAQCSEELYNIMLKCWDANQEIRPTFTTIHEQLTEMLEDKQQKPYINILEFNDAASEISNGLSERFGSLSDLERYTLA